MCAQVRGTPARKGGATHRTGSLIGAYAGWYITEVLASGVVAAGWHPYGTGTGQNHLINSLSEKFNQVRGLITVRMWSLCKSVGFSLRRFESCTRHTTQNDP